MPLNSIQRETLHNVVTSCVDSILETSVAYDLKIQWLRAAIDVQLPPVSVALQILYQHTNLIQGLATAINVPQAVRADWAELVAYIGPNADQPPANLLKQLETLNNYNPVYMAEVQRFENALAANPALNSIAKELICLREACLEMTPLTNYSYGENYNVFHFRIGNIPFNLDHCGPTPIKGEIQEDIVRLIEDRIEQAEKYQKGLLEQERQRKVVEERVTCVATREQDFAFAVGLFLDETAEQRRREQFKREAVSAIEAQPRNLGQLPSLSELLFPSTTQNSISNCVLYVLSEANRPTFETQAFQKAVVLCFDPNGSSSSSGARVYQAYFIEQGRWVTAGNEILKVDMGNLKLSSFEEGLLKKDKESAEFIQQAEQKRRQVSSQSLMPVMTSHSTVDRRFLEMQAGLNNRITEVLRAVQAKMRALDAALKASPKYLELRKAECCKVLLDVQSAMVTSCLASSSIVDWNTINQSYEQQLDATYKMYIEDMCVKWMANRAMHLDPATLKAETERFTSSIEKTMESEVQSFQRVKLNAKNIRKLDTKLSQQKKDLNDRLLTLKGEWDAAIMPLATLADQCGIVRGLRTKVQTQGITNWPSILETLHDIEINGLKRWPNTLDRNGFCLLHYACWIGNMPLVKGLVEQEESIYAKSQDGYVALHFAVENLSDTTIPLLECLFMEGQSNVVFLRQKTTRDKIPLHIAASCGNLKAVEWLLEKLPDTINAPDRQGNTPLHEAARHNHVETVRRLLALGADGRALSQYQESPVELAVLEGHVKTAQVFFDGGIWLNKQETAHCMQAIEKHPNPRAVIDSIVIPMSNTLQALSQLQTQGNRQTVGEQAPSMQYLPLYSGQNNAQVTIHPVAKLENAETKEARLDTPG